MDEYDPTSLGWDYENMTQVVKTEQYIADITWNCPLRDATHQDSGMFETILWLAMRQSDACVLLYDASSRASFEALKPLYSLMSKFMCQKGDQSPKPIVLMATKVDLVRGQGLAVPFEEAGAFAHGVHASLVKGSAMTSNGLDEMVNEIIRLVVRHRSTTDESRVDAQIENSSAQNPKLQPKKPGRFDKLKFWSRSA